MREHQLVVLFVKYFPDFLGGRTKSECFYILNVSMFYFISYLRVFDYAIRISSRKTTKKILVLQGFYTMKITTGKSPDFQLKVYHSGILILFIFNKIVRCCDVLLDKFSKLSRFGLLKCSRFSSFTN